MNHFRSGALSVLMLDLGLFKICLGDVFLFPAPAEASNPAGQYPNPFN